MSRLQAQPATAKRTRLWFGLLGGAFAWLAHLLLAWGISEFGCVSGLGSTVRLGLSAPAWLGLFVSILAFGTSAAATLSARAMRKRLVAAGDIAEDEPDLFLARTGLITSALFTLVIVVESIPLFFYLKGC